MATPDEWGTAYARQARADYDAWNHLQTSDLPDCQKLHFLQMACEKLAKAHLCKAGNDPDGFQSSHAYVEKNLPLVLREQLRIANVRSGLAREIMKLVKHLSREIELLAPAVRDGGRRPDNCEYPWEDRGTRLWVPIDYQFTPTQLLARRHGTTVLKLIAAAAIRRLTHA